MKARYLLLCGLVIFMAGAWPALAGEDTAVPAERASGLLSAIGVKTPDDMTRGGFLTLLMNCIDYAGTEPDNVFSDGGSLAPLLKGALDLGFVSPAREFRPAEPITYAEAVKMCCAAAGYGVQAVLSGGYPAGYLSIAREMGLEQNLQVQMNTPLTAEQAQILLYNTLNAEKMVRTGYGENYEYKVSKTDTLLRQYHGLYQVKGILNADSRTSLSNPELGAGEGKIQIGGQTYLGGAKELLGKRVLAFVWDNEQETQEVKLLFSDRNQTEELCGGDITAFSDGKLVSGEQKDAFRLENNYDLIYNGKSYRGRVNLPFLNGCQRIALIDNDRDGIYEVVIAERAAYTLISKVDSFGEMIYGEKGENNLDLSRPDCEYTLEEDGQPLELYHLQEGALLAAMASEDGRYLRLTVCGKEVSGTVEAIDFEGRTLRVDGKDYDFSDQFAVAYPKLSAGVYGRFLMGLDGKLEKMQDKESGFRYGFVVKTLGAEGLNPPQAKLLTQAGAMLVADFADKCLLDGKTVSAREAAAQFLQNGTGLIRYALDGAGKLSKLDTPAPDQRGDDAVGSIPYDTLPENDRLIHNVPLAGGNYTYKSASAYFYPRFSISNTLVFVIPKDRTDWEEDKNFEIGGKNSFVNDQNVAAQDLEVYNLDSYGSPEALVYYTATRAENALDNNQDSAVVEKISREVNADGAVCYKLSVFYKGAYTAFYLDAGIDPNGLKNSKRPLGAGDIVRFRVREDTIVNLMVDFDAHPEVMAPNAGKTNAVFNGASARTQYQSGKLYSAKNGLISLTPQPEEHNLLIGAAYQYAWSALRSFPVSGDLVIIDYRYKKNSGVTVSVRAGLAEDLLGCLEAGEQADYVVLRQYYLDPKTAFVYKTHLE